MPNTSTESYKVYALYTDRYHVIGCNITPKRAEGMTLKQCVERLGLDETAPLPLKGLSCKIYQRFVDPDGKPLGPTSLVPRGSEVFLVFNRPSHPPGADGTTASSADGDQKKIAELQAELNGLKLIAEVQEKHLSDGSRKKRGGSEQASSSPTSSSTPNLPWVGTIKELSAKLEKTAEVMAHQQETMRIQLEIITAQKETTAKQEERIAQQDALVRQLQEALGQQQAENERLQRINRNAAVDKARSIRLRLRAVIDNARLCIMRLFYPQATFSQWNVYADLYPRHEVVHEKQFSTTRWAKLSEAQLDIIYDNVCIYRLQGNTAAHDFTTPRLQEAVDTVKDTADRETFQALLDLYVLDPYSASSLYFN
ncbi:hypothetical protein CALVIDRAFT_542582 [Calocera viscosa TUFC12733]|uniref:Uncharacterized protein n=1 Tax=Calocera viscosa (strain TUFC12733) TaxID=1330018 RepID=A0A167GGX0_CALVF|nr:hypothetical protein CALVIDRAFT_542582 [Calocera viscosa TUFC12733]